MHDFSYCSFQSQAFERGRTPLLARNLVAPFTRPARGYTGLRHLSPQIHSTSSMNYTLYERFSVTTFTRPMYLAELSNDDRGLALIYVYIDPV